MHTWQPACQRPRPSQLTMVEVDVQQVDDPPFETYTGDGNASGPCTSMQPLVLGDVGRENLLALH
eukprot:4214822-Pleurochrysis_carterae.AAC.1